MKKYITVLLIGISMLLLTFIHGMVQSTNRTIQMVVDGANVNVPLVIDEGTTYVALREFMQVLKGHVEWDPIKHQIELQTQYKQKMYIDVKRKRILKEGLWRNMPVFVSEGHTYYPLKQLSELLGKQVEWDANTRELHVFDQVRLDPAKSIARMIAFHGFELSGEQVHYTKNGTKVSLFIDGKIKDISLLEETAIGEIKETKYALFWQIKGHLAHIVLTVREFPDGSLMYFTEGYTPIQALVKQEVTLENDELKNHYYWGNYFLYRDRGDMRQLTAVKQSGRAFSEVVSGGVSFGNFFIQSPEELLLKQKDQKIVWETSKSKHRYVWWLTPEGAFRGVPEAYLTEWENGLYFNNLQAGTPQLIMDTYKQNPHPLFKTILDNAMFTMVKLQGEDGYWRTKPNVAYLNRAFGLGEGFIDTRMSADASIFLLDYYYQFGNQLALEKAVNFANYFTLHDKVMKYYQLGKGRIYPDYYAERQFGKPLVSLNHVLHEINYLLLMADVQQNPEYLTHADWMLKGIQHSKENWIAENGDLYYALNANGEYYATDYEYITYRDLFATKSFLLRHKIYEPAIDELFSQKHSYLQEIGSTFYESDLSFKKVFETFDVNKSSVANLFLSTPLELQHDGSMNHYAVGAFHWISGAKQLNWNGQALPLNSFQKYLIADLKNQVIIMDNYPEDIRLSDAGMVQIVNADQFVNVWVINKQGLHELTLEPEQIAEVN